MDVIVAALATWQIVEIWRHSELTADWLDSMDNWLSMLSVTPAWWQKTPAYLARLLLCPWCLSVWVGISTGALYRYGYDFIQMGVFGLAVSRLANLGNDLSHSFCRTPNRVLSLIEIVETSQPVPVQEPADLEAK